MKPSSWFVPLRTKVNDCLGDWTAFAFRLTYPRHWFAPSKRGTHPMDMRPFCRFQASQETIPCASQMESLLRETQTLSPKLLRTFFITHKRSQYLSCWTALKAPASQSYIPVCGKMHIFPKVFGIQPNGSTEHVPFPKKASKGNSKYNKGHTSCLSLVLPQVESLAIK